MGATQDSFDLQPGRVLARKFEVIRRLGAGWEGEVYLVRYDSDAETLVTGGDPIVITR